MPSGRSCIACLVNVNVSTQRLRQASKRASAHPSVDFDDVFSDAVVNHWVAFIQHDEEQVEAGHDRCRNVNILLQQPTYGERLRWSRTHAMINLECFALVITTTERVGSSEDGSPRIQSRLFNEQVASEREMQEEGCGT